MRDSISSDSTNWELHSTVAFTTGKKKHPLISGPMQFKPLLFKGQLYLHKGLRIKGGNLYKVLRKMSESQEVLCKLAL